MKADLIKTIANKTKATKHVNTNAEGNKHKKEDNHKKRPIYQFRKKLEIAGKMTSLTEKTHSVLLFI